MKIKFSDYQISLLTQLFEISPDSIRLYAKKGLLKPMRNEENRYRVFSREDVFSVEYLSQLKKMGFSLEYIRSIMCDSSIVDCERMVMNRMRELDDEICKLIDSKNKLIHYAACLKNIQHDLGNIHWYENVILLYTDIDTTFEQARNEFRKLDENLVPLLTMSGVGFIPGEDLADMYMREKAEFIFMCEAEEKHITKLPSLDSNIQRIAQSSYLSVTLSCNMGKNYMGIDFFEKFLNENNLSVNGRALSQYICSTNVYGDEQDFYKVWLPVK